MATAETTPAASSESNLEFRDTLARLATVIIVFALIAVIIVYLFAPFNAMRWARLPFLGGYVEPTIVFNASGPRDDPSWGILNNRQYEIRYPDRLISVDNTPIHSSSQLAQVLQGYAPGDTVQATVELTSGNSLSPDAITVDQVVTLPIRLIVFPPGELLNSFLIPYLVGATYLVIGLWVFFIRRSEAAGRLFALFCASVSILIGGIFDIYTTHNFAALWSLAVPLIGAGLIALSLEFPQPIEFVARRSWPRWLAYAPAIALGLWGIWAVGATDHPYTYATAWLGGFVFSALSALLFIGTTYLRWIKGKTPQIREQSGFVLLGSLGFLPLIYYVVVSSFFDRTLRFSPLIAFTPTITFPIFVAIAILRHRLLNAEVMLRRAIIYGVLGGLATLAYFLLVYGASLIAGATVGEAAASPWLLGIFAFVLVVAFRPAYERLQATIDTYFFKSRLAYQQQLQAFGRALTESSDLPHIAIQVQKQIEATLQPSHLHLFLRDVSLGDYAPYAATGRPATDLRFAADGALARTLSAERIILYLAPDSPLPDSVLRDRSRIMVLGSRMFVPLKSKDQLVGWLALGNRLSGDPYQPQDLQFLESLADQSALAIERAMAFDTLEKRVNELNVLSQVSQAVNFSIRFDDLLELVYAQASRVLDLSNFTIIMRDPATDMLTYAFFVENDERDESRENQPWPMGQGLASEVIRSGQPILTEDYLEECSRRRVAPLSRPYKGWMAVPLNAGSGTLGAMTVGSLDASRTFTNDQLKILAAIADQAATAIDKARLFSQTEERARQLAALNEVSQTITSTLDLDSLLQRILESAVDILGCEAGSLFLIDEETNDSVLRVAVGSVANDIIGIRVPAGRGIVGSAAQSGNPIIVNDTTSDPRWFQKPDATTGFISRTVMAVPLRVKDRNIGVLEVINKRSGASFTGDDTTLLTAFAGQAAVAIENARLFNLTDQALAARVEELSVMQRIDRDLNAALDVQRVMQIILDRALAATNANAGLAGLVFPEGIGIVAHEGYGEAIEPFLNIYISRDIGLVGKSVAGRTTSVVRDVRLTPDYMEILPDTISHLVVPIVREEETIAVLVIESNQPDYFVDDHIIFLTRLADHAVIAITNAQLYGEVNAANQAKSEFVSMVSHELKNPMQSIKGFTQLISSGVAGPVNEGQQQFLTTVLSNVERMITIVSDLTDVARIESGRLELNIRPMSFTNVITEVMRSMQAAYDAKEQNLVIETSHNMPPVMGDEVRLTQILTNLVSNAGKYSPNGSIVTLRAEGAPNHWDPDGPPEVLHVSVKDKGYGISPEDQRKLFTKFFRADNNKGEAPGTGLGLNIVKQMVELGGGKVWFESEPGKGSTFHFTVPLADHLTMGTRPLGPLPPIQ